MNQKTFKVKKEQIENYIEGGTIVSPVQPQGDVNILVTRKNFLQYMKNPQYPTCMLEIAMYDNWDTCVEKFT